MATTRLTITATPGKPYPNDNTFSPKAENMLADEERKNAAGQRGKSGIGPK